MYHIAQSARALLIDLSHFSRLVLRRPLRRYQLAPARAIIASVLDRQGLEFLLVFPRQSGKNEVVAQVLVYLLNLYQRHGGNIVYGAIGDGKALGVDRLEERLDNAWNRTGWTARTRPDRRTVGRCAVVFLSSHPSASTRGQTAHLLMVIDEAQDQTGHHIESVFTPMRAANNATAVYIGTVKHTSDYLWQKKLELEREQRWDGIQRVFFVTPDQVTAENPAYRTFLEAQIRKHGRQHPIVASEYFLEPIDATGGLFDERRRALMRGDHPRQHEPEAGSLYVATLDVAGEDEAATDPIAQLARPGRDYTVATIFQVAYPPPGTYAPGPTFQAVDVFVDHGSRHFQDVEGQPALIHRLIAWLQHWQIAHIVGDESGVGQGMISWLRAALGEHRVTGFNFAGTGQKAALGSAFLSLIETGRFKYWAYDPQAGQSPGIEAAAVSPESSVLPMTDAWWFWQQVRACSYEIPPEGRFDRDLRWEVPPTHKTDTPEGPQPTHDDRLLSAALVAELDRLLRTGQVIVGTAESAVIDGTDPLQGLTW